MVDAHTGYDHGNVKNYEKHTEYVMSCEFCRDKKNIQSQNTGIFANITSDSKFRIYEYARYDRGIDDSRWVNMHSEFKIKFCPMCGEKIE